MKAPVGRFRMLRAGLPGLLWFVGRGFRNTRQLYGQAAARWQAGCWLHQGAGWLPTAAFCERLLTAPTTPIFDKLTNAAKDFFIEPEGGASAPAPNTAPPTVQFSAANQPAAAGPPAPGTAPAPNQAEQRHLNYIAGLLTGNGKDFSAYIKDGEEHGRRRPERSYALPNGLRSRE